VPLAVGLRGQVDVHPGGPRKHRSPGVQLLLPSITATGSTAADDAVGHPTRRDNTGVAGGPMPSTRNGVPAGGPHLARRHVVTTDHRTAAHRGDHPAVASRGRETLAPP